MQLIDIAVMGSMSISFLSLVASSMVVLSQPVFDNLLSSFTANELVSDRDRYWHNTNLHQVLWFLHYRVVLHSK